MLTGEIRNQIDNLWNAFWTGGISNPLEVIEQITYLLFLRRLDDLQTLEENKAPRLGKPIERRVFPEGKDPKSRPYADFRRSRFKNFAPAEMDSMADAFGLDSFHAAGPPSSCASASRTRQQRANVVHAP
jgi:type I restriction enzyme M protein